jgi:hypothetical protein
MRRLIIALALVAGTAAAAEDCGLSACGHWTTKHTYPAGAVRLNWTHVYEGRDTVFRIDFLNKGRGPKQLKVEGQPVFNKQGTIVAFPSCADDGCQRKVSFVDLSKRREIGSTILPYEEQIYVEGQWQGDYFLLKVSIPGVKDKVVVHRYRVAVESVVEER